MDVAKRVLKLAASIEGSPLKGSSLEEVEFLNERIQLRSDTAKFVTLDAALRTGDGAPISEKSKTGPNALRQFGYKSYTPSAVFAEVEADEDLGTISVCRVVSAIAGGRIINHATARNQIIGGVVWAMGMALAERAEYDTSSVAS